MLPLWAGEDLGAIAIKGTPYSPKLQQCWNLTIRLFSVITRTLNGGGGLTPLQRCSQCILQPQPTGQTRAWKSSSGNCVRNWNLTIGTSGICIRRNPSRRMRCTNFSGILRYKEIRNLDHTTRPSDNQKKKKKEREGACRIVGFAVPVDYRVKLKESKKSDTYLDIVREVENYGTWRWRWYQL